MKGEIVIEKLEYQSVKLLEGQAGRYIIIPAAIILASEIDVKRTSIFTYLSIRRGLDNVALSSVEDLLQWLGKKPDYHPNGINDKIKQILTYLAEKEFIYSKGNEITSKVIDVAFNSKKLDECINSKRFAVIYLDEIDKILSFKNPTPKDVYVNNDVLLLVFAFLRMLIYRRRNKLMPEEINLDNKNSHEYDIESRRERCPEAYDCYYYEIADELGLTTRTVSKAVGFLDNLGLIYFEPLPRTKYCHEGREKWRTEHTIFSNKYKREGKYAIASGEDYYLNEVKNKRKRLEQLL